MSVIAANTNVPVSVKCRIGVDDHDSYNELCKSFINFLSLLVFHLRTRHLFRIRNSYMEQLDSKKPQGQVLAVLNSAWLFHWIFSNSFLLNSKSYWIKVLIAKRIAHNYTIITFLCFCCALFVFFFFKCSLIAFYNMIHYLC